MQDVGLLCCVSKNLLVARSWLRTQVLCVASGYQDLQSTASRCFAKGLLPCMIDAVALESKLMRCWLTCAASASQLTDQAVIGPNLTAFQARSFFRMPLAGCTKPVKRHSVLLLVAHSAVLCKGSWHCGTADSTCDKQRLAGQVD